MTVTIAGKKKEIAEKATEMSLSQSVAEIMKEKAAGNEESEEKPAGVPLNEEGKPDFSAPTATLIWYVPGGKFL